MPFFLCLSLFVFQPMDDTQSFFFSYFLSFFGRLSFHSLSFFGHISFHSLYRSTYDTQLRALQYDFSYSLYCNRSFFLIIPTYVLYLCSLLMFSTYVLYLCSPPMFSTYVLYLCSQPMFSTYALYLCSLPMFSIYVSLVLYPSPQLSTYIVILSLSLSYLDIITIPSVSYNVCSIYASVGNRYISI